MKKPDRFCLQALPIPGIYRNGELWWRMAHNEIAFAERKVGGRVVLVEKLKNAAKSGKRR